MRISDWSSDVCSSDLLGGMICDRLRRIDAPVLVTLGAIVLQAPFFIAAYLVDSATLAVVLFIGGIFGASMVGGMQAEIGRASCRKEGVRTVRSRWSADH